MRKRKIVAVKKCDYCGSETEQFVITANHLAFCYQGFVGKTTKDCHEKYLKQKEIEDVRNEQLRKKEEEENKQKEKKLQEEKIKAYPKLNNKLDELYDTLQTPKTKRTYL